MDFRKPARRFLLITEVMVSDQNQLKSKSGLSLSHVRVQHEH